MKTEEQIRKRLNKLYVQYRTTVFEAKAQEIQLSIHDLEWVLS